MERRTFIEAFLAAGVAFAIHPGFALNDVEVGRIERIGVKGGTYTLSAEGKISSPIPWNAKTEQVNRILKKSGINLTVAVG